LDKVTFGIINCNRLHYLKSCYESIVSTTSEYAEKEIIVVDNASTESGTLEFLESLRDQGVTVVRNETRDPSNEFARGLNTVCRLATGEFIIPLQGDMQFIVDGWLTEFVGFYRANIETVGCITLDAQRRVTHNSHARSMTQFFGDGKIKFCFDLERPPFAGAGDCMYSRKMISMFMPWSENNQNHEGTMDSETDMLQKVQRTKKSQSIDLYCAVPAVPAAIAIYTDQRGTNARVRGNKRYGEYWPAKGPNSRYYSVTSVDQALFDFNRFPISIEDIASPIGWIAPIDSNGSWMKNPIRPETAQEHEFVVLD
jgi:glycosyltransferase involved in cell wall biosynthesis